MRDPNIVPLRRDFDWFRSRVINGHVNAAHHMTRDQLAVVFRDLLAMYADLPSPARQTVDGALQIAHQASQRGETFR